MIAPVVPKDIPEDLYEDFQGCASDPDLAVQAFFRIKDMRGQLVQFIYNRAQRLVQQRSAGSRFSMVLKAKKVGVSSRRFAHDLWACATQPNQHAIMLAQTDADRDKMFVEKIKPLLDNCLVPLGGVLRADYAACTEV